ncbi:uncharacterized protein K02A2.6-like [Armigeres subalbatus]|uniref:uncharacterized protein K02A2.6-like n=1 Tax=Armigeres subalbatus TaxID=124917 RepID=UPI002ED36DB9
MTRAESWALRLLPYQFTVKRVPGHSNIADALSRLISKTQIDEAFDEENDKHVLYALDAGAMNISWTDIQLASEGDEELEAVRLAIDTDLWPERLRRYESQAKELRTLDPMLFKGDKIVLPKSLRSKALDAAHQGHIGCGATKRILREYFWWPNMSKDAEEFSEKCGTCLLISRKKSPIPLSSREMPHGPWEILQVDFSPGICDNGPPFQGNEFIEYWESKGVRVRKSIPLSPQSNGSVERQNQGIIKAMAGAKEDGKNWRDALECYTQTHNTLKQHSRLCITPFELMVGWKYRGTFPCLWDSEKAVKIDREDVRENDAFAKLNSKKYADQHRGARESDIAVGDKVVVATFQRNKTDPTFSKERYTVLTREGAKVVIRSESGVQLARNVQDVKRDTRASEGRQESGEDDVVKNSENLEEAEVDNSDPIRAETSQSTGDGTDRNVEAYSYCDTNQRPKRMSRKPNKFNDMILYQIFS